MMNQKCLILVLIQNAFNISYLFFFFLPSTLRQREMRVSEAVEKVKTEKGGG